MTGNTGFLSFGCHDVECENKNKIKLYKKSCWRNFVDDIDGFDKIGFSVEVSLIKNFVTVVDKNKFRKKKSRRQKGPENEFDESGKSDDISLRLLTKLHE